MTTLKFYLILLFDLGSLEVQLHLLFQIHHVHLEDLAIQSVLETQAIQTLPEILVDLVILFLLWDLVTLVVQIHPLYQVLLLCLQDLKVLEVRWVLGALIHLSVLVALAGLILHLFLVHLLDQVHLFGQVAQMDHLDQRILVYQIHLFHP